MLERERVGRLAFLDDAGRPRVLPITFAIAGDAIWSVIDEKPKRRAEPARVRWLRARPEAALVVDVYDDDWSELAWVQVLGRVEILAVEEAPAAIKALAAKYEPYRERRPPGPLLRLAPERALCWRAQDSSG
ncbi:MAG: pyridoxamine 5'-phosphate oxidase family protein [Solirubrobacterales bacterium]